MFESAFVLIMCLRGFFLLCWRPFSAVTSYFWSYGCVGLWIKINKEGENPPNKAQQGAQESNGNCDIEGGQGFRAAQIQSEVSRGCLCTGKRDDTPREQ